MKLSISPSLGRLPCRTFYYLALCFCVAQPLQADIPISEFWPVPTPPPGTNPAEFAAPRVDWIIRVEGNLSKTEGKHLDLIFDGDSITDGWIGSKGKAVWDAHYAPLNAFDFGIGGDRVENVLWRLKEGQAATSDPKLIVLMIGTNNTGLETASQIAAGIKTLVAAYLQQCPHARLLLLGVFPRGALPTDPLRAKIKDINKQISTLDDGGKRVTYLDIGQKFLQPDGTISADIMPDYLHPNEKGYQIWADAIAPEIEKTFPNAAKLPLAPAQATP